MPLPIGGAVAFAMSAWGAAGRIAITSGVGKAAIRSGVQVKVVRNVGATFIAGTTAFGIMAIARSINQSRQRPGHII